ncbi:MAG: DUF1343 domain-containing protein [Bacteroidales bacterium]
MRIYAFALFICFSYQIASVGLFARKKTEPKVKPGIEVLRKDHFKLLEGKKVGLITNPTGVDTRLKSTIDILHEAPNVNLVALYGPEHGVRGNIHAGDKVDNAKDEKTGLPVYSLYGKTRKPTPEMLQDIDVMVYDIQDIGCRSFTYISTMGLAMEACAENGKEFIVLDRPNPLGGERIEGNLAEEGFFSFVSQWPVPYLYGLTCGELAEMINGENMIRKPCHLTVVKMKGWKRKMSFMDTGLEWVISSPHIPRAESAFFYPVSGILGELGYLSIGVGYTMPFQLFAKDSIDADDLAERLNRHELPGVIFRPIHIKPFYSTGQGKPYEGVQVHITDPRKAPLSPIQFVVMEELYKQNPENHIFQKGDTTRFGMFDKVCGTDYIRKTMTQQMDYDAIRNYWNKDTDSFRKLSKKYYLYK